EAGAGDVRTAETGWTARVGMVSVRGGGAGEQRRSRLGREPGNPGDIGNGAVPAADEQGVDGALLANPGDQAGPVGVGQVAVTVQRVGGAEHGPVGWFGPARVVGVP